jgi:hypothetical protein
MAYQWDVCSLGINALSLFDSWARLNIIIAYGM